MKKSIKVLGVACGIAFAFASCEKCKECHYDGPTGEVEIGEYCDDAIEDIEASGFAVGDTTYDVHCGEH